MARVHLNHSCCDRAFSSSTHTVCCCSLLQFIFPHAMSHPLTAVVKTLLDQAFMAPAGIGVFFVCMAMMEGHPPAEAWETTKQKFKPTLLANYALWPAANLINFAFVPPSQRILYCNVVYVSSWLAG